jgi:hypothetical protein
MSFDLYLISLSDGKPSGIPRDGVRAAFGEHVRWEDDESGWTQYGETDGCSVLLSPLSSDPSLTSCISMNRPVSDHRLWDALYRVMQLGNVAVFFPGMKGPLVTRSIVAGAHLPPDMYESLGRPVVISSGTELFEQIRSS